jgi:hypothetical protein
MTTLLYLLLTLVPGIWAGKVLEMHSFTQETALATFTSRWANFGTSVPLKSHIILTPSVPDRWGAQFHKFPLLTDRFEVNFSLNLKKLSTTPPSQSFAFWYVKENVTAAVPESLAFAGSDVSSLLTQSGFTFAGYRGRFEGVAVVFTSAPQPSIALLTNDGSKDFRLSDLSQTELKKFDFRKNPRVEVKIVFDLSRVVLSVRDGAQGRWTEITAVQTKVFSGGFIGLTGIVETGETNADVVMIDGFKVENLDLKQKGEEEIIAPTSDNGAAEEEEGNLLADYGEVAEHKAIKILTRNIYRLISETEEPRRATASAVKALNARLDGIDKVIDELKTELNALAGGDLDKQFSKMKDELLQISKQTASSKEVKRKIEVGGKPGGKPRGSAVLKTAKLKEKLAGNGSFLVVLLGVALFGIVAVGVMMRFKVGKWEKKHIL